MTFRIETIWAFTVIDGDDEEGVVAFRDPATQTWMPLIASDHTRLDLLKRMAQDIANLNNSPVQLAAYTRRVDLEPILPEIAHK